ncbi:MAG: DUF4430 domain-containing protein [Clostridia bacterium]|nr:DUF4430 domain-containing protein [Clostridia bacterium]
MEASSSAPDLSDVGGVSEWYIFSGLGEETTYAQALNTALQEENLTKNAVTRQKIALAGLAVLDPQTCPLFASYLEDVMANTVGKLGLMSWVFGLHLVNNGQVSPNYTEEQILATILSLQTEQGGWGIVGTTSDVDATAMVLCALAPYGQQEEVDCSIQKALVFLSEAQQEDGSFKSYGVSNAESCAQVGMALVCLEISAEDSRFIKNGQSVWDALETFYTENGYRHTLDGDVNPMATAQGLCARETLRTGRSPFQVVPRYVELPQATKTISYKVPVSIGLTVAALCVFILLYIRKKRALRHWLPIVVVWILALVGVWTLQIQSPDTYEQSLLQKENPIGTVVLTIEDRSESFEIEAGDTVLDVLRMAAVKWKLPVVITNSGYVSEIDGLAEFDRGPTSGWKYKVNDTFPSVGAGDYGVAPGDRIEWVYTS